MIASSVSKPIVVVPHNWFIFILPKIVKLLRFFFSLQKFTFRPIFGQIDVISRWEIKLSCSNTQFYPRKHLHLNIIELYKTRKFHSFVCHGRHTLLFRAATCRGRCFVQHVTQVMGPLVPVHEVIYTYHIGDQSVVTVMGYHIIFVKCLLVVVLR